jgi:hypothetical protein
VLLDEKGRGSFPETKPKKFSFPWGSGIVEEEVQIETDFHCPTIQLLRFTEGEAAGKRDLRFCSYSKNGRFSRNPLIFDVREVARLKRALKKAPKLRKILARLAD